MPHPSRSADAEMSAGRRFEPPGRSLRRLARLTSVLALAALLPSGAFAQSAECDRLQTAIRSSENDAAQGDTSDGFERAARQQRSEIERTQHYADQVGCNQQQSGMAGDDPPPECADLDERLQRMENNLERIETQAETPAVPRADRAAQQAALIARYNAICVGQPASPAQHQGGDPNDGRSTADLRTVPVDPDELSTVPLDGNIMDEPKAQSRNAGKAVCVRTCDGGYFPIAPRAAQNQLDGLDQLCKASCPNTEARLYTMGSGGDLASATSVDGTSYMDLPAAYKFEKTFTASCTCKPPDQSWVQALAEAEKLLGNEDRRDITVTTSLSDQMSKPVAPMPDAPPPKGKVARTKLKQTAAVDPAIAADASRAAQVPTATNESAGIGGQVRASKLVKEGAGPTIAVAGPDGITKRIRLIVP